MPVSVESFQIDEKPRQVTRVLPLLLLLQIFWTPYDVAVLEEALRENHHRPSIACPVPFCQDSKMRAGATMFFFSDMTSRSPIDMLWIEDLPRCLQPNPLLGQAICRRTTVQASSKSMPPLISRWPSDRTTRVKYVFKPALLFVDFLDSPYLFSAEQFKTRMPHLNVLVCQKDPEMALLKYYVPATFVFLPPKVRGEKRWVYLGFFLRIKTTLCSPHVLRQADLLNFVLVLRICNEFWLLSGQCSIDSPFPLGQ